MKMVCNACKGPGFSYCVSIPHSSASLLLGCGLKITQIEDSINLSSLSKRTASLKQRIRRQIQILTDLSTTPSVLFKFHSLGRATKRKSSSQSIPPPDRYNYYLTNPSYFSSKQKPFQLQFPFSRKQRKNSDGSNAWCTDTDNCRANQKGSLISNERGILSSQNKNKITQRFRHCHRWFVIVAEMPGKGVKRCETGRRGPDTRESATNRGRRNKLVGTRGGVQKTQGGLLICFFLF